VCGWRRITTLIAACDQPAGSRGVRGICAALTAAASTSAAAATHGITSFLILDERVTADILARDIVRGVFTPE
jgi:ribose 5-phosphate isomerase RpiB